MSIAENIAAVRQQMDQAARETGRTGADDASYTHLRAHETLEQLVCRRPSSQNPYPSSPWWAVTPPTS